MDSGDIEERLEAKEIKLGDIFSEQFIFNIPIYQRPFSWTRDRFEKLIEDITDAMENGDKYYFIGSIIIRKRREKEYDIIDGQQRLTSIAVLLAVARDLIDDEEIKRDLASSIYQKPKPLKRIPETMRIRPWREFEEIFRTYIYVNDNGTQEFLRVFKSMEKSDAVYHLYEAIETFTKNIKKLKDEGKLEQFLDYLMNNVYLVYIKTNKDESAFRLFNVLNTRGLPLSPADILKSKNLEAVPENKREHYAEKWRSLEEDLGRKEFDNLIGFIRTIYAKEKARSSMHEEFEKLFKDKILEKGESFFKLVDTMGGLYLEHIINKELSIKNKSKENQYRVLVDIMGRYLPFSDWIPPVLYFLYKFPDSKEYLPDFLSILEKKVFIEWCAGFTATERITNSVNVIDLLETTDDPKEIIKNVLTHKRPITKGFKGRMINFEDSSEVENILLSKLNSNQFYRLHGGKFARYVLLRLDMTYWDLENLPLYPGTITVEHILPRNPSPDSEWLRKFTQEEIQELVDKLGNLALLSSHKNSKASNYDFKKKIDVYFKVETTPFRITQQLREYEEWTPEILIKRHNELLDKAKEVYLSF